MMVQGDTSDLFRFVLSPHSSTKVSRTIYIQRDSFINCNFVLYNT